MIRQSFQKAQSVVFGTRLMPSTRIELELKRLLRPSEFEKLLLTTPDRRERLSAAAKLLNCSELAIVQHCSEVVGVPVLLGIQPVVMAGDQYFKYSTRGAIPIIVKGVLTGVACVDPGYCKDLIKTYRSTLQVFMASWGKIKSCYQREEVNGDLDLGRRVLTLILERARAESCFSIRFDRNGPELNYCFDKSGREDGQGRVCDRGKDALVEFLSSTGGNFQGWRVDKSSVGWIVKLQANCLCDEEDRDRVSQTICVLIDDNPIHRHVRSDYLARKGITVLAYKCLDEVELKNFNNISFIILDLDNLKENGLSVVRHFREKIGRYVPVVCVASDSNSAYAQMKEEFGVSVLSNRCEPEELIKRCWELLDSNLNEAQVT